MTLQSQKLRALLSAFNVEAIKTNLTAIKPNERAVKLIDDSLLVLEYFAIKPGWQVIDVGTGGGFPGLPLAIVQPEAHFTLIEATGKKAAAIRRIVSALGLANVRVQQGRAEELAHGSLRGQADLVVARALAPLLITLELTLPLAKLGGQVVLYQGPKIDAELPAARAAVAQLGGGQARLVRANLATAGERRFVFIAKQKATPKKFPRTMAEIKKQALH